MATSCPHTFPVVGIRVWIVPHTHWDREWYLPFEQFRMRLVRMVAELVEVMERDPRIGHFTLDGQAVILEDVAELRPELIASLRALAARGQAVGRPWLRHAG